MNNGLLTTKNFNGSQTTQSQPENTPVANNSLLTTQNVDASQMTQSQLKNILDDNNPLQQQAKTQGLLSAQDRGLLNTTMGQEAGQAAMYQYAVPIATADANTNAVAARTRENNANQMAIATMNKEASLAAASISARANEENARNARYIAELQAGANTRGTVSSAFTTGYTNLQNTLNSISGSNMSDEAKQQAAQTATANYQAYVNSVGSVYGVDLGNLLSQWGVPAGAQNVVAPNANQQGIYS